MLEALTRSCCALGVAAFTTVMSVQRNIYRWCLLVSVPAICSIHRYVLWPTPQNSNIVVKTNIPWPGSGRSH